ncbi:hypothetical protein [Leifsonia poae]|uniref:hypothetical protein n=1 Tax=Leifsonia poae TaxID=110933 RepID=UPI001CBBA3B3|nr:hypothetical protein [Leifsonia poae]
MRFVSVGQKTIVVGVLLGVNLLLMLLLNAFGWEPGSIVLSLLQLAGWYLASRMFRGAGEDVARARPWWRMTAKPLLSGVLGAGYALLAAVNLVFSLLGYGSASGTVSVLVQAALATLFLNSYRRLRRGDGTHDARPRQAAAAGPSARRVSNP